MKKSYKYVVYSNNGIDYSIRAIHIDEDYYYNIMDLGKAFGVTRAYVSDYFKYEGERYNNENSKTKAKYVDIYDIKRKLSMKRGTNTFIDKCYGFVSKLTDKDYLTGELPKQKEQFPLEKFLKRCVRKYNGKFWFRYAYIYQFFGKTPAWHRHRLIREDFATEQFGTKGSFMDFNTFKRFMDTPNRGNKNPYYEIFINMIQNENKFDIELFSERIRNYEEKRINSDIKTNA